MNQLDAEMLKLFDQLLAYHDDELSFSERMQVEALLDSDPRYGIHLDSLNYLDLEREVAIQDGEDLRSFDATGAGRCCQVLAKLEDDSLSADQRQTLEQEFQENADAWAEEILNCPLCRRLRRRKLARQVAETRLPEGEPLLREWLLEEYYLDALESKVRQVAAGGNETTGDDKAASHTGGLQIVLAPGSGRIRSLRSATAELDVRESRETEFSGFICRSRRSENVPGLQPALLDDGPTAGQSTLELQRTLKDNLGSATIRLVEASTLTCEISIAPGAGLKQAVTVSAQLQGNQVLKLDGVHGDAVGSVPLGSSEVLEGQTLEIEIGQAGEVLESYRLTFSV